MLLVPEDDPDELATVRLVWLVVVESELDDELLVSVFSTMPDLEFPVPEKIDSLVRVSVDSTRRMLALVATVLVVLVPNEYPVNENPPCLAFPDFCDRACVVVLVLAVTCSD